MEELSSSFTLSFSFFKELHTATTELNPLLTLIHKAYFGWILSFLFCIPLKIKKKTYFLFFIFILKKMLVYILALRLSISCSMLCLYRSGHNMNDDFDYQRQIYYNHFY